MLHGHFLHTAEQTPKAKNKKMLIKLHNKPVTGFSPGTGFVTLYICC